MTERKRVMVSFSPAEWEEIRKLKQKNYELSYAEVIRMVIRDGLQILNTEKAEANG